MAGLCHYGSGYGGSAQLKINKAFSSEDLSHSTICLSRGAEMFS